MNSSVIFYCYFIFAISNSSCYFNSVYYDYYLIGFRYEVDHIVQFAEGGTDDTSNLQALCPNCHSDKTEHDRQAQASLEREKETIRDNPYYDPDDDEDGTHLSKPFEMFNFKYFLRYSIF